MIHISEKSKCCGCSACHSVCPVNAILMKADEEGFLYPEVEETTCINCGKCELVCPIINGKKENEKKQFGFVVQSRDPKVLRESTSGGAFTAIAEYVLDRGGIVYGAAFDSQMNVGHIGVTQKQEMYRLRGSKYVQSEIGDCFKIIKTHLLEKRMVLFSGTPCQVEGLLAYLGNKPPELITVDVVCHAVPSPLIWKKYIEYKEAKIRKTIENVRMRDKFWGYQYSSLSLFDAEGNNVYHNGIETDEYLRAFFSNICDRPACYMCAFKKRYRESDCTLWDCFEVDEFYKEADNNCGVTKVLIHNESFLNHFKTIKRTLQAKKVDPNDLVSGCKEMVQSVPQNTRRIEFFMDARMMKSNAFFKKYFPVTAMTIFEKLIRLVSYKLGIYRIIRRLYKNLFGDRRR